MDGAVKDEVEQPPVLPSDFPKPTHTDPAPLADTHQDTTLEEEMLTDTIPLISSIASILLTRFHPFH